MRLLFTLLIALTFAGSAVADQVPETPLLTGPNFQQVPASDILVLPTGGSITTLGDALATSTGNLSSGLVTATGSTTARTLANRASDVFNIMDYGAACDGSTNDNTAINAALTAAHNSTAYTNNNLVVVTGPTGTPTRGCVMNSLNLAQFTKGTGANTRARVILRDMRLLCTGAGNVCLDALGADFVLIEDVTVRGDSAPLSPAICLQVGVISATSAAWNTTSGLSCNNEFTFTALYNFGSEANTYTNSFFVNAHSANGPIGALGAITAGSGYANSTYTNVSLTGGTGTGALATITTSAGAVTAVTLTYEGRSYVAGDTLSASFGGGSGFSIPVASTKTYAAVIDGQNHWRASSIFATETLPTETWQSLTLVAFMNSHVRALATNGGGLWSAWASGLKLYNAYILNQNTSGSCIDLYNSGVTKSGIPDQNSALDITVSCEGPSYAINLIGTNATPSVFDLHLNETGTISTAVFSSDPNITAVTLSNAYIDVSYATSTGVPMFRSAKLWSVTGNVKVTSAANWNAPASFKGTVTARSLATPPALGPVDILAGAAQAVSCARLLLASYTGPLCEVTRTSDSTTLDIYPNTNGDLDQNAFTGFCKGTTCNVSIMYDQSGNSNDFTQSTTASQPALSYTATLGNRPALAFGDAGAIAMTAAAASSINDLWATGGYVSTVVSQPSSPTAADRILYKSNGAIPGVGWDFRGNAGGRSMTFVEGAATTNGTWSTTGTLASQLIVDIQYSSASLSNVPTIGGNGTSIVNSSTQPVGAVGSDAARNLLLGNNAATGGTRGYSGSIAEVVMWKTTPTATQLEAVRRNQAAYYGVSGVN